MTPTPGIRMGATGFIAAAEFTRRRLMACNVPQPRGNRLEKAERLVRQLNDRRIVLQPDDDTLRRVTDGLWTIFEQYLVARTLKEGRALSPLLLAKLETMLSGAEIEDDDRNPLARNTQFELYAAAMLTMGEVPVRLDEPDLRTRYLDMEVGIAAKRVRSASQLIRRAGEAVNQIICSGIPGIVAVNADLLFKATGAGTVDTEQLDERLAVLHQLDARLRTKEEVVASLAFARDARWQFGGERPVFDFVTWQRFAPYPRTEEQRRRGEEFWSQVHSRIEERRENL